MMSGSQEERCSQPLSHETIRFTFSHKQKLKKKKGEQQQKNKGFENQRKTHIFVGECANDREGSEGRKEEKKGPGRELNPGPPPNAVSPKKESYY
jgi:hypothetical protein